MATSMESRCRVCAADVPAGAIVCPRCGASQRMEVCPLCGATAGVSRDAEMRYRCDVCGGPRVPLDTKGMKRSGREVAALKRADAARKARAKRRAGAIAAGVGLVGMIGLLAVVLMLGAFGVINLGLGFVLGALFTTGPLIAVMAWMFARARAAGAQIQPAIDEAWLAAATDFAEQTQGPIDARALAQALRIEEPQAEELMALLEAHDVVRGDGRLAKPARLRVGPEQKSELAEIEALAEAEAEQEMLARKKTEKP